MIIKKYLQIAFVQISILMGFSSIALAQRLWRKADMVPTLVDGATTTMEQLVANSVEVKDLYCRSRHFILTVVMPISRQSIAYKDLDRGEDKATATDDAHQKMYWRRATQ